MVKRKRGNDDHPPDLVPGKKVLTTGESYSSRNTIHLQVITGSYDRVLHGIVATISLHPHSEPTSHSQVQFADNFLFNAHNSAIRCLAISPPSPLENQYPTQRLILATGGTDERINLYHVSTTLPRSSGQSFPTLAQVPGAENSKNREIGSLLHHSSSISVLHFPNRSKLLSGSDDNTISISRVRDWTVLSTIKAPIPKIQGRPSGDTAPPGGAPTGVNDFAVHPSLKLMISVGRGERCMRLWNLVTGKKAGVLTFEKELLHIVGESKFTRGEGRKVEWNSKGEEFAVAFERGVVAFGMNSKPKYICFPSPPSKVHQIRFLKFSQDKKHPLELLALSTEDGRIMLYSGAIDLDSMHNASAGVSTQGNIPLARLIGILGGRSSGISGRIKDFEVLDIHGVDSTKTVKMFCLAGSDGIVRILQMWDLEVTDALKADSNTDTINGKQLDDDSQSTMHQQFGKLIGTYKTDNRITCLKAFRLSESETQTTDGSNGMSDVEIEGDAEEDEFEGFE